MLSSLVCCVPCYTAAHLVDAGDKSYIMSKREQFYDEVFPCDKWLSSTDELEKKRLAQLLFGAIMVACVDVKLDGAVDLLNETKADNIATGTEEERSIRDGLSNLTDAQRTTVMKLVKKIAFGILYWQCVKIDQFPGMEVEIRLTPLSESESAENGQDSIVIASLSEDELHHQYYDWLEKFSDHWDE